MSEKSPSRSVHVALLIVGGLFIVAAAGKLQSMKAFELLLVNHDFPGGLLAATLARGVTFIELALGVMLFQPHYRRRAILPAIISLLTIFSVYLAWLAFVKGSTADCGCFGALVALDPKASLAKNIVTLAIAVYAGLRLPKVEGADWLIPAKLTLFSLVLVLLVAPFAGRPPPPTPRPQTSEATGPGNPDSDFAQFREFRQEQPYDLTRGRCLVAFFSSDCEHCKAAAQDLRRLSNIPAAPDIYMVFLGLEGNPAEFIAETGADFPFQTASLEVFFSFIDDSPPKIYLLEAGAPQATWDQHSFSFEAVRDRWLQGVE